MPCPYGRWCCDLADGVELVGRTWFFTRESVPDRISDVKYFVRYWVAIVQGIPEGVVVRCRWRV